MMPPILKQVKDRYKARVRILKVNVDNHPDIALSCQVQNIPAIVLFHEGKIRWSRTGVQQVDEISVALKEILISI
jgi:thioredoxin-like negative regulator of GroEL